MIHGLKIGDRASISKAFSEQDVRLFARLSTDTHPVHLDRAFAEASHFGQQVVHHQLVNSLFSALIEQQLPGAGAISLNQQVEFKAPVYIDETVTAEVEITDIDPAIPLVTLNIRCINSLGRNVLSGRIQALAIPIGDSPAPDNRDPAAP